MRAEAFMREALKEARADEREVPVGAVVVFEGRIIARAHNERESGGPFAHAEMLAMERAVKILGSRRLKGCTLYVTLEPCPMCAGALTMAEIDGCVFGAFDEKQGCCGSVYALPEDPAFFHRVPCAGGVLAEECALPLRRFFSARRGAIQYSTFSPLPAREEAPPKRDEIGNKP